MVDAHALRSIIRRGSFVYLIAVCRYLDFVGFGSTNSFLGRILISNCLQDSIADKKYENFICVESNAIPRPYYFFAYAFFARCRKKELGVWV